MSSCVFVCAGLVELYRMRKCSWPTSHGSFTSPRNSPRSRSGIVGALVTWRGSAAVSRPAPSLQSFIAHKIIRWPICSMSTGS